jgi:hypothetical protein
MAIMYRSRQNRSGERGDGAHPPVHGPIALPQRVLERHGARLPDRYRTAMKSGSSSSDSTVYRSAVLQLPDSFLRQHDQQAHESPIDLLNNALKAIGYRLAVELVPALAEPALGPSAVPAAALPDVQRRVPLEVTTGSEPRQIDAWAALQTLRAASDPRLGPIVEHVELEHLLLGHTACPDTSTEGHPAGGRTPVDLIGTFAPARRSLSALGGRRPVIAVLDTGIGTNPWLPTSSDPADDAFILLDSAMQALIEANEKGEPEVLDTPMDTPVYDSAITRRLNTHSGHGSFIAGIIRQRCPDAKVRSIRIMHDDGVIYENDLQMVLWNLLLQVKRAQADPSSVSGFVDVISLSAGYYSEDPHNQSDTWKLTGLLTELARHGVLFVASAGNDSTDRMCYPAALSQTPSGEALPLALGVGALNPNGSKAYFSNDGSWVDYWATGAAVVSTLPIDFNGAESPQYEVEATTAPGSPQHRETLDPDDFRSGFAVWSGTSFSAPFVAAELGRGLIASSAQPDLGLAKVDAQTARERAADALNAVPDFSAPE